MGYSDVNAAFYIGSGSIFHPMSEGDIDPSRAMSGHLIHDANANETLVRLYDPGAIETFSIGGWVLLHWFSRESFSFPPNPGFFEYAKVVARDRHSGELELDRPLQHPYRATAPDHYADPELYGTVTGRARILSLDRSDYIICKQYVMRGGRGLSVGFRAPATKRLRRYRQYRRRALCRIARCRIRSGSFHQWCERLT